MEVLFLAEITIDCVGLINDSQDSTQKMVFYFKGTEGSAFKDRMRKHCEPQYIPAKKTTIALFDLLSNMAQNLSEFTAQAIPEIKTRFSGKGGFGALTAATVGGGVSAVQAAQKKIKCYKMYSENLENMVSELYNLYGAVDKLCHLRDKQLQNALHKLRMCDESTKLDYATVVKVYNMLKEFQTATKLLQASCVDACSLLDS
eukprot:TRINITY_DN4067_c0_g1_i1.p4 TRINITY_DN4067_c0_g1~~TRINITY_DN4067_c0_g1_i1.p4  ORF type:complete len:234 (+),score=13.41 TRINITY_DN4067_c0_g1_i1:97-702(+)